MVMYIFPTLNDGEAKVERELCKLLNKYREGTISPEEIDWMDWANNVLTSTTNRIMFEDSSV